MNIQGKGEIDAAYKAYFDAASDAELDEEAAWAQISESALTVGLQELDSAD